MTGKPIYRTTINIEIVPIISQCKVDGAPRQYENTKWYHYRPIPPPHRGDSVGRSFASHAGDQGSITGRDTRKSCKQVVFAPHPNALFIRVNVTGSRKWPCKWKSRVTVNHVVSHAKKHSLLECHECKVHFNSWSTSPVIVTSQYNWNIHRQTTTSLVSSLSE